MRKIVMATALVAVLSVQAADPTIAELQAQLKVLSDKIAALEMQAAQKPAASAGDLTARVEKLEERPLVPEWTTNMKIKGDFRYRYENREDDDSTAKDRQRIRARVGVYGQVNDYIDFGSRLVLEGGTTSGNEDIGDDDFDSHAAKFDRFYMDVHPEQFQGAHVLLGKMPQPWLGRTGLVWDSDLNPEGIAVTYSKELGENSTLHANAGAFIISEDKGDDARLQSVQVAFDTKVGDAKVQVGVSDYWFENMENSGISSKNNTKGGGFNIIEGFGSVSTKAGDLPVKVYGQVAQNTEAATSDDTAFMVGLKLGKAKKPGTWEVGYNYRDIGKDAVIGAFNDSDFNDGNTDSKGHAFGAKYQIAKNWQAGATYLISEGAAKDVDTLQMDLNFKF